MSRSWIVGSLISLSLICAGSLVFHSASADDEPKPAAKAKSVDQELRAFMRKKLEASTKILEGLALEDVDLIQEGATTLAEMSEAEKWRVSKDVMYRQFSGEFARTARQLVDAAKDKNVDRAALRWMDTTMSCIECHRFVRNELVVEQP